MPYIIDGHNLIAKIPHLSLESPDDEMELVEMLQEFCHRRRKRVEVFFDNAQPGQPRARNFGNVIARFIPLPQTADQAIHNKLTRLGSTARNWIVVSSDHAVQSYARSAKTQFIPSEEFTRLMREALDDAVVESKKRTEPSISESEVDEWMRLFNENDHQ